MGDTLDDLRAVLFESTREGPREGIGIGKNEIHPLAYHLKRKTDGELFGDADFEQGYRGVRSPDIREAISFFEYEKGRQILESSDRVDEPDEYFHLYYEDDKQRGRERFQELNEDTQKAIKEAISNLLENRIEFIQKENSNINTDLRLAT